MGRTGFEAVRARFTASSPDLSRIIREDKITPSNHRARPGNREKMVPTSRGITRAIAKLWRNYVTVYGSRPQ